MTVADLIGVRRDVYAVRDDFSVEEAARYLRDMHVRAVGVLDRHDDLVGVVSQSDISDKVAAENKCPAWMRVAEIMTPDVLTVTLEESVDECLRLMDEHGVYRVGSLGVMLDGVIAALAEGQTAEEIQRDYPSLTMDEARAAIAFCKNNPSVVATYVQRQEQVWAEFRAKCDANPSPVVERLRALRKAKEQAST